MKFKILYTSFILVSIISFIVFNLSQKATENVYSKKIFPIIIKIQTLITGYLPFSLIELIIILIIIILLLILFIAIKSLIKKTFKYPLNKKLLKTIILRLIILISILYFSFLILWGFNYNRFKYKNTETKEYSIEELTSLCNYLTEETNSLREKVKEDENGVMIISGSMKNTLKRASYGYDIMSESDNRFKKNFGYTKSIYFSEILMYLGLSGFYSPLTGEANINTLSPDSYIPHTICHEMAHQFGFAREDEANYIGFLACKNNKYNDYKYSGYFSMLIYTMNSLYDADENKFYEIRETYSKGLINDIENVNKTYSSYDTVLEDLSDKINDTYLKANQQSNGINSYSDVIYLLIQDYKNNTI
jgi:hypothetical protein